MSHEILFDASFFLFLLLIDRDIAARAHLQRCPYCGGMLDVADYCRKPRGAMCELPDGFDVRYSLCCRTDGCRRRRTPASIRFLDRRVYLGVVTVIVATMRHGNAHHRLKRLQAELGVDFHTIQSWRHFWTDLFPVGDRGKILRAWFPEGGSSDELLSSSWKRLSASATTARETAVAIARMLLKVMTNGIEFGEKMIEQLSVIAYPQETPTDG
jgi:hypothetical protein